QEYIPLRGQRRRIGCAMQGKRNRPDTEAPVTLRDLAEAGLALTVHCRKCGHWSPMQPASLPLDPSREIPALEGMFRCGMCGSRDSCAMPLYPRRRPTGPAA
ncbi:MAG: hypothetical protein KDJ66_04305, partial [Nitratireductor sp.]|nr:hypothetical protein [Nitratireductor sp.]